MAEKRGSYSEKEVLKQLEAKGDSEVNSPVLEEDLEDDESLVPDGGWGWVVCAASFMVNFILDGTMFSFGILLLELLDDLQETKSVTSWVGSAQLGMSMMMGPMVSVLLKRFSVRQVTIAGTLISAVGFTASVFAPNVFVLIVMYGVVGGIGFSMIFLPAIIVVGLYFSKKRAIATGIATSGSGVGTFAYAYLCDYLLRIFTWRQTILILTGILLNCLACGMVFRPLVPKSRSRKLFDESSSGKEVDSNSDSVLTFFEFEEKETTAMVKNGSWRPGTGNRDAAAGSRSCERLPGLSTESARKIKDSIFCFNPQLLDTSRHRHHRRHHHHHNKHSKVRSAHHQTSAKLKHTVPESFIPDDRLYSSAENFTCQRFKPEVLPNNDKLLYFSETQLAPDYTQKMIREAQKQHITVGLLRPIFRKDIYYSGSVNQLAEYQKCGRSMTSFLAQMTRPESDDSGCSVSTSEGSDDSRHGGRKKYRWIRRFVNFELFRNNAFLCLLVTFTMWTVQSVALTYLPNLAVSKGVPRDQAAFLISIVGITNTAGRIVAGIVTDMTRVRSIWLYVIALFIAAAVNYVIPWCDSFTLLASASALFGLCMAVAVSMRTIVLAEQLGIQVLTRSFGVVALFQGLAFTVNPPIAGKLFDETGAYFWPFTMSGTMYLVSALFSLIVALWFKPLPPNASPSVILHVEEISDSSSEEEKDEQTCAIAVPIEGE